VVVCAVQVDVELAVGELGTGQVRDVNGQGGLPDASRAGDAHEGGAGAVVGVGAGLRSR
jgi:hypothetical protein